MKNFFLKFFAGYGFATAVGVVLQVVINQWTDEPRHIQWEPQLVEFLEKDDEKIYGE